MKRSASLVAMWLCAAPLALAQDVAPAPAAAAPAAANDSHAAEAPPPADRHIDWEAAEPPPTEFDKLGQQGQPSLAPESFALVKQIGRVIIALFFTITLIYLFFRLGLPRVMRLWLKQGDATYQVRERLVLDANNTLIRVEHESGMQYVLGVNGTGVKLIDKLEAPTGGPLSSPARKQGAFDDLLRPEDPKREA